LATNNDSLCTFSFLLLLYFAVFSVVSARERHWFWATMPSKTFLSAIAADAIVGTALTFLGLPGLTALPWWQPLAIFAYAMVSCLVVNDALKVAMIKWRVLNAVAKSPVDVTPQIAKRAYELYEQRGRQDGHAVQDWGQAEREIRKTAPQKETQTIQGLGAGQWESRSDDHFQRIRFSSILSRGFWFDNDQIARPAQPGSHRHFGKMSIPPDTSTLWPLIHPLSWPCQ
jgi:hypothetical protein